MPKIGDLIRIIKMKNEWHYDGKIGKIQYIDGLGQLHGTWGELAINLSVDIITNLTLEEYLHENNKS